MEFVWLRPDLCLGFIRHVVDQQRRTLARVLINEYRRKGILGGGGGNLSIHLKRGRAFLEKAGLLHL